MVAIGGLRESIAEQTDLSGRMNILVSSAGQGTRVTVNARYVYQVAFEEDRLTWSFDTKGSSSQKISGNAIGTSNIRTCRPTHAAEKAIISGLR